MRRFTFVLALLAVLVVTPQASAWSWPLRGEVLRPYSLGPDPYAAGQHRGVDVAGSAGEAVRAPAAGVVSFVGVVPSSGRTVTIQTDGYAVSLTHLGEATVAKGATVAEGDAVGVAGQSGEVEWPTPYVHLGIRVSSAADGYVDPATLLPPRAVAPPPPPAAEAPVPHRRPPRPCAGHEPCSGAGDPAERWSRAEPVRRRGSLRCRIRRPPLRATRRRRRAPRPRRRRLHRASEARVGRAGLGGRPAGRRSLPERPGGARRHGVGTAARRPSLELRDRTPERASALPSWPVALTAWPGAAGVRCPCRAARRNRRRARRPQPLRPRSLTPGRAALSVRRDGGIARASRSCQPSGAPRSRRASPAARSEAGASRRHTRGERRRARPLPPGGRVDRCGPCPAGRIGRGGSVAAGAPP